MSEFMKAEDFNFTEHIITRNTFQWGSYGKQGDEDMQVNLLKNLSTNHIYNILRTQKLTHEVKCMFLMELCYRIKLCDPWL